MLKSVYICKRKHNRVVMSVQKMTFYEIEASNRPTSNTATLLWCPTGTGVSVSDRTYPSVSAPYVTVTYEGSYPCLGDMYVTDCHRRRYDIVKFGSILCNLTTYSIKLEILTLQTRKLRCKCTDYKLWFNSWCRR